MKIDFNSIQIEPTRLIRRGDDIAPFADLQKRLGRKQVSRAMLQSHPAALRLYHSGALSLAQLWRAMSLNPARRLGLKAGRLAAGAPADLVLFDPDAPFVLDRFTLLSKSKNTPFDGQRMEGKVLATFVGGARVFGA